MRADTIEQAMRDCMSDYEVTIEGYKIAYAVVAENLALGLRVVADSVNPLNITRDAWRNTAIFQGKEFMDIEVICSDATEHRRRVKQRVSDIQGLKLPTWDETVSRKYEPWTMKRLIIDTTMLDTHLLRHDILQQGRRQIGEQAQSIPHSQFQPQQHIPQTHCLSHENEQQENREGKREYLAEFGKKPTLQKIHSGRPRYPRSPWTSGRVGPGRRERPVRRGYALRAD